MGKFRIKELAHDRGMVQEDLAFKSGIKLRTVQRLWQNKIANPSIDTMIALADALGVTVKDLYADEKQAYNPQDIRMPGLVAASAS